MEKTYLCICFFQLILLIHFSLTCSATAKLNITTDQSALLALKSRVTYDPYRVMDNWLVSHSVCNWTGVTCGSRHRRVTALNVSHMDLAGEIPPQFGNLSFLINLDMRNNHFIGILRAEFSYLRRLRYMRLSNNNFTDSIPFGIFNISTLQHVSFSNNNLSGTLPDDMCVRLPRLNVLSLTNNEIQGQIPSNISACGQLQTLSLTMNNFSGAIPVEIGQLHNLEELDLSQNMLMGTTPTEISNLTYLYLDNNKLTGSIPVEIGQLDNLLELDMSANMLKGTLPSTISELSSLLYLYLGDNNFTGVIPQNFTKLTKLLELNLQINSLSGSIPIDIFNISGLLTIDLALNNVSGNLPSNIGYLLPNLNRIYLDGNNFHGVIPNTIINCSKLTLLDLAENRFTGVIPNSIGELRLLQILNLVDNNFTSKSISSELSFITSLVNSRYLTELGFSNNPHLNGILPASLGNLSSSLHFLDATRCQINGHLPNEIGNLSGLVDLYLDGNNLVGPIPETIHGLENLQRLYLGHNRLSGFVPYSLCELKNIGVIDLRYNQLTGSFPECFGNILSLREIHLDSNNLNSSIPESVWKLKDLLILNVFSNSLSSAISPQIGNLNVATDIDFSLNKFSGFLPNTFQKLQNLINFSLAHNRFQGPIPDSLGAMLSLALLDLSDNNLSGTIPKSLEGLTQLEYFNVSFNELSGDIPTEGPFSNFTGQFFTHNYALCGLPKYQVSPCQQLNIKSKMKNITRTTFLTLGFAVFVFALMMVIITMRHRRKNKPLTVSHPSFPDGIERFSYYELLHATNEFSESNLLGRGSFGSVYKCVFGDGRTFAVKVLNMQLEGAVDTFFAECEVLRNLRHKNLTKVITSISNEEFKAIVLEYMPNGSLEKWLHSNENSLTMMQKLNIMINVASALEYLHHGCSSPVVHCDLKPNNVLLDDNMIAHVCDFGISKLLGEGQSITHTMTLATMGYMAPEYGLAGLVSTRGDVYSYGIMLLETFTGKKPSDALFSGELTLKQWVRDSQPNGFMGVIDNVLIRPDEEYINEEMHSISSILELALSCLANSPSERLNMVDVLAELMKIKNHKIPKTRMQNARNSPATGFEEVS